MRASKGLAFVVMVAMTAAAELALAADTVYANNFNADSKQIVAYPIGAPLSQTLVGPQPDTMVGMDFDRNGTLWSINLATQTLGTISLATGAFTPVVAVQGGCCTTAFTIDPVSGAFLISRDDALVYRLDPATGATTIQGEGVPAGNKIAAMTMNCDRRLFAAFFVIGNTFIYRTDLQSAPTSVGALNSATLTAFDFDNPTGKLYAWLNTGNPGASTHAEMNPTNALLSNTANVPGRYRMAIDNACTVAQLRVFGDGFEG